MKYLIIILAVTSLSCKQKRIPCNCDQQADSSRLVNMGKQMLSQEVTNLQMENEALRMQLDRAAIAVPCPSTDSLKNELYLAKFKLERIKYYLNICLRNPKQDVFLKGWIRRVVE